MIPGVSASTTKPDILLFALALPSVLASTKYQFAFPPLVIQHFVPFKIHLSPSFRALVLMLATSDPAPGSTCHRQIGHRFFLMSMQLGLDRRRYCLPVTQYAAIKGSSIILLRYFCFVSCDAATIRGASASPFA